jgi:DeoR/GlpR family transcriptional regulator of sugar metabolism
MADRERLDQIRKYIRENNQVEVVEISKLFNVSTATARRDLDQLAEIGEIQRIHGGARLIQKAPPEPPVMQRRSEQSEEKKRIARMTASLVQDGETVLMGGGTSVYEVARELDGKLNLSVITNSILVIEALVHNKEINLIALGGLIRHDELLSYGHFADLALAELYADKVILGVRSISLERGLTIDFVPEFATEQVMLTKGKEVIVVCDHTKFNRESTLHLGDLSQVDIIVTDEQAPDELLDEIRATGTQVYKA